ncbi:hypothetical protein PF011_g11079 [Phytophthora fragariae]|uniref:Uncharacterized protein n=1 Tax=Phytophthora fragariae TaxID=53985 RepID=A0A6A3KL10_9STRA|nr:hypothetical protein PF011_g11079 [Phytophthora fragariae]
MFRVLTFSALRVMPLLELLDLVTRPTQFDNQVIFLGSEGVLIGNSLGEPQLQIMKLVSLLLKLGLQADDIRVGAGTFQGPEIVSLFEQGEEELELREDTAAGKSVFPRDSRLRSGFAGWLSVC